MMTMPASLPPALRSCFSPKIACVLSRESATLLLRQKGDKRASAGSGDGGQREAILTQGRFVDRPTPTPTPLFAPAIDASFGRFCALASPSRCHLIPALGPFASDACPRGEKSRIQGRCEAAAEVEGARLESSSLLLSFLIESSRVASSLAISPRLVTLSPLPSTGTKTLLICVIGQALAAF